MSTSGEDVPVRALYTRILQGASRAYSLPTIEDETQEIVDNVLSDLEALTFRISSLHLFSANEFLEDLSTTDMIYMTIPYIYAEIELNARARDREARLNLLRTARRHLEDFSSLLSNYGVIPEEEEKLYKQKSSLISEPAKRRETKIAQFKKEKELKGYIAGVRTKRGQVEIDMNNIYDLVESLLPSSSMDDEDSDLETESRRSTVYLLRLLRARTAGHVEITDQELMLLRNAPPGDIPGRSQSSQQSDSTWRLDTPTQSIFSKQGPLMDSRGKPLRPFQILPSSASSDRQRLQAGVFGPDHRLPSITIDEYLQVEQERGNIISGGGPQSETAPTRKEQLAIDSEMDGTREGDEKTEEKRREDERWARFADENPRGAGNTMNRG